MNTKEAIILAGGMGTRLQNVVKNTPKPLALVNDKPFIFYLLDFLYAHHFNHVILSVGYLYEQFIEKIGNKYKEIEIDYAIEKERLGTGGGIKNALYLSKKNDIAVLNGDTYFNIDISKLFEFHLSNFSKFTMALKFASNVSRYGEVIIDDNHSILEFKEKNNSAKNGNINAGIYIVNKLYFLEKMKQNQFSLELDFFPIAMNDKILKGLVFNEYFIDIGIPEDYSKANEDFKQFKY